MVHLDHMDYLDQLVHPECQELKDPRELLELMGQMVNLDHKLNRNQND